MYSMGISKAEINRFVEDLRQALHNTDVNAFTLNPPYNIEGAIQKIGGTIETGFVSNDAEGEVYPTRPYESRNFKIRLPYKTGDLKDRFTLAHELGHIMLHFHWPSREKWVSFCKKAEAELGESDYKISMFRQGRNQLEYEANHFAACFLMPEDQVKSSTASFFQSGRSVNIPDFITKMSAIFQVSSFAMETRLKFLGILPW